MSPATPTTTGRAFPNSKRRPIGLSLGQYRRTNDSLTTATSCADAVSDPLTSRPALSGTPNAANRPGVTYRRDAVLRSDIGTGCSGIDTGQIPPRITIGVKLV